MLSPIREWSDIQPSVSKVSHLPGSGDDRAGIFKPTPPSHHGLSYVLFATSESAIFFAYVWKYQYRPLGRDLIYEMNRLGSEWFHSTRPSFAHLDHNSARRHQPRF